MSECNHSLPDELRLPHSVVEVEIVKTIWGPIALPWEDDMSEQRGFLCALVGEDACRDAYCRGNGGAERPCGRCQKPVWLSLTSQAHLAGHPDQFVSCPDCIEHFVKGTTVVPCFVSPSAVAEFLTMMGFSE